MRELRALLVRYARETDPVLVVGESGTGKSLIAQALHRLSSRHDRDPVTAALAGYGDTARAELFGSRRGAYTGSVADHHGLFKQADGSTLILEDVPDLPPPVQAMLLRAIQEKRFRPMQALRDESADVRVIATTNRPLQDEVREGRFRLDLYHRLRVFTLAVPPLRERPEDLDVYVPHYLGMAARPGVAPKRMSESGMDLLREYRWPGNVRELANVLREVSVRTDSPVLWPDELRELLPPQVPQAETPSKIPLDKAALLHTLLQTAWNKREAARKLSISRPKLYRLLEKYGITVPSASVQ
jgi:DNA-binding NtrC family response regulator